MPRYRIRLLREGAQDENDCIDQWFVEEDNLDYDPVGYDERARRIEFVTADDKKVLIFPGERNSVTIIQEG